jgi:transcriptional regulator with XRE-family HTH domain
MSKVVGQSVRSARRELGMTQAELATRLGVGASYVANLEAGRTNPTVGQLAAVADALRVDLDVVFRVVGQEEPDLDRGTR